MKSTLSEERGWKTGIDERLEALDMQAGRIRVGAGDLTDCVLSHLGGQDENSISQCTQLAGFIDNVTMAPDPLEAPAEVRVGLIDILKHEHAVRAVLQGLQQRGALPLQRGTMRRYGRYPLLRLPASLYRPPMLFRD